MELKKGAADKRASAWRKRLSITSFLVLVENIEYIEDIEHH